MSVIVIAGPTASGKTALGVKLAKELSGEVISCDSMQIYKDLPICSAMPTREETEGIPHHLMGFLDFNESFSVEEYRKLAEEKIRDIIARKKQPIIVGGTGMYFHYLIYEPDFAPKDEKARESLEKLPDSELYEKYAAAGGEMVEKNDRKRLIRALEVLSATGKLPKKGEREKSKEFDFKMFCISPEREILYDRINARVDRMFEQGLENEVRALFDKGATENNLCVKAIGCRQMFEYFRGEITLIEAKEKIKQESRRYAKRQLTWMRKEDAVWIDPAKCDPLTAVLNEIGQR